MCQIIIVCHTVTMIMNIFIVRNFYAALFIHACNVKYTIDCININLDNKCNEKKQTKMIPKSLL